MLLPGMHHVRPGLAQEHMCATKWYQTMPIQFGLSQLGIEEYELESLKQPFLPPVHCLGEGADVICLEIRGFPLSPNYYS